MHLCMESSVFHLGCLDNPPKTICEYLIYIIFHVCVKFTVEKKYHLKLKAVFGVRVP